MCPSPDEDAPRSTPEPAPETPLDGPPGAPQPGYAERFDNREVRWRAVAGSWEASPEGVRAAPGRVAGWFVCRAVRPPDITVIETVLRIQDFPSQPAGSPGPAGLAVPFGSTGTTEATGAAAVSIITDQGHRAASAALDVRNRQLLLLGSGTEVLARMPLPDRFNPDTEHRLALRLNGPNVAAELDGESVEGRLRRTIFQGLLAFWTDPGVEAVYRGIAVTRAFREAAPLATIPPDWQAGADTDGTWSARPEGFHFQGERGLLVKASSLWEDVQVSVVVDRPEPGGAAGLALRGQMEGLTTFTLTAGSARLVWDEGGGREERAFPAEPAEVARLTLRRTGRTAHLWLDDRPLGSVEVPTGPSEIALLSEGPATFRAVEAAQWL